VNRQSGAFRIFLYNWPIYVGSWVGAALAILFVAITRVPFGPWIMLAAIVTVLWSVTSLLVSFYIYDRSPLARGSWVKAALVGPCEEWATIHAGLDREVDLNGAMPGHCVARLDIFDPLLMTAGSIQRARYRTPQTMPSTACSPTELALDDGACDVVVVAFTAHEIRDTRARESFFDEIRRGLRTGGTMLVVEHTRDLANFAAFGPGYLHFLPRAEWRRLASRAGFALRREARVTPWVTAFTIEKTS
jgi:SAM-dependent methyltransferase